MASGVASGGAGQAASGATRLEARAVVRDDAVQLLDTACWRMGPARSRRALINWPHGPSAHCPLSSRETCRASCINMVIAVSLRIDRKSVV